MVSYWSIDLLHAFFQFGSPLFFYEILPVTSKTKREGFLPQALFGLCNSLLNSTSSYYNNVVYFRQGKCWLNNMIFLNISSDFRL